MDADFLLVMWCYHRCAFLLDSMVTVPDGDIVSQTAGTDDPLFQEKEKCIVVWLFAWCLCGACAVAQC